MSTPGRRQLHRSIPRVVAAILLALAALTLAAPAAAETCGKKVIDDWAADFRVDGTYALHCYDDAIEELPRDVRDYSSAKEDIERAMQKAMRGEGDGSTTDPDTPTSDGGSDPDDPTGTGSGSSGGADPPGGDEETAAAVDVSPSSDSIPLPLLVLAGLALLLLAAGSIGYVIRRLQARRVPPPSSL